MEEWSLEGRYMQRLIIMFRSSLEALFAAVPGSSAEMWFNSCPMLVFILYTFAFNLVWRQCEPFDLTYYSQLLCPAGIKQTPSQT